jgi:hypothetical protein
MATSFSGGGQAQKCRGIKPDCFALIYYQWNEIKIFLNNV